MRQIRNYTVEDIPIGVGGMGQVLRGVSSEGIPVAIKEILPEFVSDPEFRYRIDQEVKFLVMLNQKLGGTRSVVRVFESFELDGKLYIVMELVEGRNIEQLVGQEGALPFDRAGKYMEHILDSLQSVHEQHVVHRDIKPGNIMIRPDNSICILDFGVAKDSGGPIGSGHTVTGTVIGTDGYMSPEQANGMSIDHRSDIYSLACVFFFMLTGHHAYVNEGNDVKMMMEIVNKPFPQLSKYMPGLPPGLQQIIDKASDKNMMRRYQSCREFNGELKRLLHGGTMIDAPTSTSEIIISVGRENCDIVAGADNYKVSRHHADIKYVMLSGGRFYVYTDCSSNGSTVNGTKLLKGMSYNIPVGTTPEILLANDPSSRLDWSAVERLMQERLPKSEQSGKPKKHKAKTDADNRQAVTGKGFLRRLKTLFKHK